MSVRWGLKNKNINSVVILMREFNCKKVSICYWKVFLVGFRENELNLLVDGLDVCVLIIKLINRLLKYVNIIILL